MIRIDPRPLDPIGARAFARSHVVLAIVALLLGTAVVFGGTSDRILSSSARDAASRAHEAAAGATILRAGGVALILGSRR